jgi:cell division septal protein FtsQ
VNYDTTNLPHSRNWRDIPQHVKPRAMSPGGRRRLVTAAARVAGLVVAAAVVTWGAWVVAAALQENPKNMPDVAKAVPVKNLRLKSDGVLDADVAWLARTLALPKNASLMTLDLQQLRARLLAGGQVSAASLTRKFPDTLEVRVTEREPIARLRAEFPRGDVRELLVARDGVAFEGAGFGAARLGVLPWLDGVKLTPQGARFAPIAGVDIVARLLEKAKRETPRLYDSWQVVSLAKLDSDDEIEVRTKTGTLVVFGAKADFFLQLAKLDYQWEVLANATAPVAKIDLSLGREVPVTFASQPAAPPPKAGLQFLQPPPKREL